MDIAEANRQIRVASLDTLPRFACALVDLLAEDARLACLTHSPVSACQSAVCTPIDTASAASTSYASGHTAISALPAIGDQALTAYRSGVGSITDATLAQSQLLAARNAEVDSYAGALSAAAALTTGTIASAQ